MKNRMKPYLVAMLLVLPAVPVVATNTLPPAAENAELECVIEPSEVVDLGSPTSGVIETIHVERSDLVEQGTVVAELEAGLERATVEVAREKARLTTELELGHVSEAYEQRKEARHRALYTKHVLSRQIMDKAETNALLANLKLRRAGDERRLAALEFKRSEEMLKRRTLRSPIKGIVTERFKSVGEFVDDEAVVRIAQVDPLYVEVIAPIALMGRIARGMPAKVTPDGIDSPKQLATVTRVDRVADAASSTFGVRLELPNPEYRLPGGIRCRVSFDLEIGLGKTETQASSALSPRTFRENALTN